MSQRMKGGHQVHFSSSPSRSFGRTNWHSNHMYHRTYYDITEFRGIPCPEFCPLCHRLIGIKHVGIPKYGNPIRTCPKCIESFADKSVTEYAISGEKGLDKFHIAPGCVYVILLALAAILFFILLPLFDSTAHPGDTEFLIVFTLVAGSICAIVVNIQTYPDRWADLLKENEASLRRLSNPDHVRRLLALGVDVPFCFIKEPEEPVDTSGVPPA